MENGFILVPTPPGGSGDPRVEGPPCLGRFLELFEQPCVVACCGWSALDLSEDRLRQVTAPGGAAVSEIRGLLVDMLAWTRRLDRPCIISGPDWAYDPEDAREVLTDTLVLFDTITRKP